LAAPAKSHPPIALGDDCPIALLEGGALVVALADIDSHMTRPGRELTDHSISFGKIRTRTSVRKLPALTVGAYLTSIRIRLIPLQFDPAAPREVDVIAGAQRIVLR
jgi:hypothetical protein